MLPHYKNIISIFLVMIVSNSYAGIEVGGTRVIFNAEKKEANLSVKNSEKDSPYLIQSWLDNGDENKTSDIPFIVTPPLFRLDPQHENQLRIINIRPVPQDRESMYWLSVKSIAASSNQPNRLQISVRTRIKMIYRPESIKKTAADAYKKLTLVRHGDHIVFHNPTPHYISFFSIMVGQKSINEPMMVPPLGTYSVKVPQNAQGKISWRAINDFGGRTDEVSK